MSPIAASIAARVRGPMPRGFSLDASLTMVRSSRPSSRASSAIGLPGWYGAIERTYEGESSHKSISIGSTRYRVGPEDFEIRGEALELGERGGHALVLLVALDVDEKDILPQRRADLHTSAGRARFDARHADAGLGERREQRVHRAGLVLRGHDERGAVLAGRLGLEIAEHQEARGVVRIVLDGARQDAELIALRRRFAGDRRRAVFLGGAQRRIGVGRHGNSFRIGKMLREPPVA